MILLGIVFIVFGALIYFAGWSVVASAFVVGGACVVLGIALGESLPTRK